MPQDINTSREFYRDFFSDESKLAYDNKQRYEIVYSLIDQLQIDKNSWVLDIGAGSGRISEFLESRFQNVISLDIIITPLLENTIRKTQISPIEGALPSLPFVDGAFDLVVCSEVLEHIPTRNTQYEAIRDIARVIKKDGYAVISTPNPKSPQKRTKDAVKKIGRKVGLAAPKDTEGQIVENWIPPSKVKNAIESDFRIQEQRGSYYVIYIPKIRFEKLLRPISDAITMTNIAPNYGLYQYYVLRHT